jgi:hypothetical protein
MLPKQKNVGILFAEVTVSIVYLSHQRHGHPVIKYLTGILENKFKFSGKIKKGSFSVFYSICILGPGPGSYSSTFKHMYV